MQIMNQLRGEGRLKGSRVFGAEYSELALMMRWVREILGAAGINSNRSRKFEIAIEEALTNIVHYAYQISPGLVEIIFDVDPIKNRISFSIIDQGSPFNPIEDNTRPEVASSVDRQVVGGLGIHLMKELTGSLEYQRIGNSNVLKLSQVI